MAVQVPPLGEVEFHGVFTAGNPIQRPRNTAAKCQDIRVMPGNYLRLAGGRKARYNLGTASKALRIIPFRDPHFPGSANHIIQVATPGAGVVSWYDFASNTFVLSFPLLESISTSLDSSFALTNPAAGCLLTDRPLLYNGLGIRNNTNSRPPFSTVEAITNNIRYFGLDAFCVGGLNPTVAFAAGAGFNTVLTKVSIYVGLYNSATGHYSNGVLAGSITTTGATGTITVSNLNRLTTASHGTVETLELFYVFYATVDNGQVPYLILNSTLDGPAKTAITNSSMSLSIQATNPPVNNNGWVLDLVHEMPFQNFPPRPMRSVCYVNGRIYGALLGSGQGGDNVFSYSPVPKDLGAVVWSQASGDSARQNVLGNPNESWPLTNIAYTPSADAPTVVFPAQDSVRVLVLTPTSCFLLQEVADGIHEYLTISRVFGCKNAETVRATPHGICWVTQNNEIVMLPPYSTSIVELSQNYQSLINGTVTCADWIFDPTEQIDRYQIWMSNGVSVIHDFLLGGEAYTRTGQPSITAAATTVDGNGVKAFVIAGTAIYTHETQPENGLIPTTDDLFTHATNQTPVTTTGISGEYDRNWDDFGASDVRKELPQAQLTGDLVSSALLAKPPITVDWYADLEQVTGANKKSATIIPNPQGTQYDALAKLSQPNRFWYKFVVGILAHVSDNASFANFVNPGSEGDLAKNFYGSLLRMFFTIGPAQNR